MTTETKTSFADYSLAIAVKETATSEKSVFTAIVAISALLAGQQASLVLEDKPLDENKLANGFRAFLKRYAYMGNVVWRDSEHLIDAMRAAKPEKRAGMASDYIDKKVKGSRLVDGLARMRTYAFKLVKDTLKNHAGVIRNMIDLKEAGAENDAIAELWTHHVQSRYGTTYAALASALRDDKPSVETNDIDVIMRKAEKMTITELNELCDKLEALRRSRSADETEFTIALDGDGTPQVIPRLAA
jgi:predicted nucleotidyltransferase